MKKAKSKAKPAISRGRKTSIERDMRVFHRTQNWAAWWEEFYTQLDTHGGFLYKSVAQFARKKAESNKEAIRFMRWYLGPASADPDGVSPYPWCVGGSQDWYEKRRTGGWFSDQSLRKFGVEVRRRMHALEALREAGNGITLHSLVRAEQLAQELDRSFNGRMFLDELSFEDNELRANSYISLHERILNMKARAQDLYARSHGLNFEDLSGFTALMSAAALNGSGAEAGSKENTVFASIVKMALEKNAKYNLDLPPGAVEVITDVSEHVERKKKVQ